MVRRNIRRGAVSLERTNNRENKAESADRIHQAETQEWINYLNEADRSIQRNLNLWVSMVKNAQSVADTSNTPTHQLVSSA